MYTYQLVALIDGTIRTDVILKLPDYAYIPNDPENTDWQTYQVWLAQGNNPLPPEGN
jgi:hypothetical protein